VGEGRGFGWSAAEFGLEIDPFGDEGPADEGVGRLVDEACHQLEGFWSASSRPLPRRALLLEGEAGWWKGFCQGLKPGLVVLVDDRPPSSFAFLCDGSKLFAGDHLQGEPRRHDPEPEGAREGYARGRVDGQIEEDIEGRIGVEGEGVYAPRG